ncbi:DsbA family protein [Leucobacter sp. 1207-22]|uniref:DsbA family protein n=1 Tax=Leucobacter sp. 1207-22 TaxID=2604456 RepID=UPI0040639221
MTHANHLRKKLPILAGAGAVVALVLGGLTACSTGSDSENYVSQTKFDSAPANMQSGGALFTSTDSVVASAPLSAGADRVATDTSSVKAPTQVSVFVDFMCPACGSFEQTFGEMLTEKVDAGEISLEVTPLTFLNRMSQGTNYSTRAANLFACTVSQQPEYAYELQSTLLSAKVQPAENTKGLSNEELVKLAKEVGIADTQEFVDCAMTVPYGAFLDKNSEEMLSGSGIVGLADGAKLLDAEHNPQADGPQRLLGTPLVLINGEQWDYSHDPDLDKALAAAAK